MSGRTFTYTAGFDSFVAAILPDMDAPTRRRAGGVGDGMLRDVEEFINRFCVTATNDDGDITFDAAGTYTFSGSVVIDGTLTTNGNTTVNGNVDVVASAGGGLTLTASGGTAVSSWLSSQNAGWRFMPSTADWEEGEIGTIPSNRTLANEFWALVLRSPYYDNPERDFAEINLYSESEDATSAPRINMDAGSWDFDLNGTAGVSFSYLGANKLELNSDGDLTVTGDVGIGTTSPDSPLHVSTSATTDTELLRLTGAWSIADRYAYIVGETSTDGAVLAAIGVGTCVDGANNNDGGISFLTTSAADTTLTNLDTNMVLTHQGYLGIGTTSPASQLDVLSAGNRTFEFERANDVGSSAVTLGIMKIGTDSDNPGTNDYWILFRRGDNTTIGSVRGTGSASVNFSTTSDATLKNDNGPVTETRIGGIIDGLQIHDFDWKEGNVKNQIGVFAQEAIQVLPEGIVADSSEDDDGSYLPASLDYSKIVPILVAEVQFLRRRVAALESRA